MPLANSLGPFRAGVHPETPDMVSPIPPSPLSAERQGYTYRYEVKTLRLEGSSESPRSEQSTLSSILPSRSH